MGASAMRSTTQMDLGCEPKSILSAPLLEHPYELGSPTLVYRTLVKAALTISGRCNTSPVSIETLGSLPSGLTSGSVP